MSINRTTQLSRLACITVTFNPDLSLLQTQLAALAVDCPKVIVDNASSAEIVKQIETMINATPNARLLRNSQNEGLGAAVNAGIGFAKANWPDARLALLLDQDSEPRPGSIETLHNAFESLETQGRRVGCVGPTLIDAVTGSQHGFHQCSRWRWKRVYPPAESTVPVLCANLNGSGTLVSIELFQELGGLDETLFIDHVDTEWSFRVLHAGYGLWGRPNAIFAHRMGQD
ncbi:MAG: glycosyltransferase, partial [Gammaproteobacteria bacterium]